MTDTMQKLCGLCQWEVLSKVRHPSGEPVPLRAVVLVGRLGQLLSHFILLKSLSNSRSNLTNLPLWICADCEFIFRIVFLSRNKGYFSDPAHETRLSGFLWLFFFFFFFVGFSPSLSGRTIYLHLSRYPRFFFWFIVRSCSKTPLFFLVHIWYFYHCSVYGKLHPIS